MFRFVFVDLTTDETPAAMRPAPHFDVIIKAMEAACKTFSDNARTNTCTFRVAKGPGDRIGGEIAVNFRNKIPEAPSALAYHTTTNGVPDIEIGVDLFTNIQDDSDSLTCGLSHELFELLNDAGANGWKDRQDGSGIADAEEACDMVQNTGFMAEGCFISNFLLPNAFIPASEGPWDYLGVMKKQYDTTHGYGIQSIGARKTKQVEGEAAENTVMQMKFNPDTHMRVEDDKVVFIDGKLDKKHIDRKRRFTSRTYRRGIRL